MTARYRPGKVPEWAKVEENDDGVVPAALKNKEDSSRNNNNAGSSRKIHQAEVVRAPTKRESVAVTEQERVVKAIDISALSVPEAAIVEEEDDDRRARIRARMLQRKEEDNIEKLNERVEFSRNDESDASTSSEEEEEDETPVRTMPLFKPIFVSQGERDTVEERERLEKEKQLLDNLEKARLAERRHETRQLVIDEIKHEEAGGAESDTEMPDDTDDLESEEAMEAWKLREAARITRDIAEREALEKEKRDVERRRDMTDIEIIRENNRLGLNKKKEKTEVKFMQKYYHKGAFYQDDENDVGEFLKKRDFLAPTGYDKEVDMTMMPKVMQVKDFGLAGRTKYTHLVDQDTTKTELNPWAAAEKEYGIKKNPYKKTKSNR